MSKFTNQIKNLWTWFKTRQKMTLLAGAVVGAIFDDPIIALVQALL